MPRHWQAQDGSFLKFHDLICAGDLEAAFGDQSGWFLERLREIVDAFARTGLAGVGAYDADDLFQDVYTAMYYSAPAGATGHDCSQPLSASRSWWETRMQLYCRRQAWRLRRKREARSGVRDLEAVSSPDDEFAEVDRADLWQTMLAEVRPSDRLLLKLLLEGCEMKTIAAALGCSTETVRTRKLRLHEYLRGRLLGDE